MKWSMCFATYLQSSYRWFALFLLLGSLTFISATPSGDAALVKARDLQDLKALDGIISQYKQAAGANPKSADAQYKLALANSYAAEVALELKDKKRSEAYAEAGIDPIRAALALNGGDAEYHRLYGQLCGQVIPANPFFGALKYGQCARDEINKALELDNKLALAYVSRGVGNYYLPAQMGGGVDVALKDIDKAIEINPKLAEAYLWKGVALRKAGRNAEARQALEHALQLDPDRLWAKQELAKIPGSSTPGR
jgi:tetratricopeptide (TPR) repeat protein